jgi:hypothetical protein
MGVTKMHVARWNRLLAFSAVCLVGVRLSLIPAYGQGREEGTASNPPPRCSEVKADFVTHLGLRYLNAGDPLPAAFQIHSATLDESGSARFRVYELTDDVRFFCDATALFTDKHAARRHPTSFTVRAHPAEPLKSRRVPVQLLSDADGPYVQYAPIRRWGPHRETLRFVLHVSKPNSGDYIANFDLTVPGLAGTLISGQ